MVPAGPVFHVIPLLVALLHRTDWMSVEIPNSVLIMLTVVSGALDGSLDEHAHI